MFRYYSGRGKNNSDISMNNDEKYFQTLHMVTAHGFEKAWPEAFSPHGSKLTAAMDVARCETE